ncbi:hypothetical protein CHS0354_034470, partial [Potamilus streckersoni]
KNEELKEHKRTSAERRHNHIPPRPSRIGQNRGRKIQRQQGAGVDGGKEKQLAERTRPK